jgi:hypothetical protein
MKIFIEIIGWTGSVGILAAYALNSYQKIKSNSLLFLVLNIIGGILLCFYSFYHKAFANSFLNVVWMGIAIPPLVKIINGNK